jgi:hypothetical protein
LDSPESSPVCVRPSVSVYVCTCATPYSPTGTALVPSCTLIHEFVLFFNALATMFLRVRRIRHQFCETHALKHRAESPNAWRLHLWLSRHVAYLPPHSADGNDARLLILLRSPLYQGCCYWQLPCLHVPRCC